MASTPEAAADGDGIKELSSKRETRQSETSGSSGSSGGFIASTCIGGLAAAAGCRAGNARDARSPAPQTSRLPQKPKHGVTTSRMNQLVSAASKRIMTHITRRLQLPLRLNKRQPSATLLSGTAWRLVRTPDSCRQCPGEYGISHSALCNNRIAQVNPLQATCSCGCDSQAILRIEIGQ